jgi:hypothetical protein
VQALCLLVLMTCGQALAAAAFSTAHRALHSIQHRSAAGSARSRKLPELPANYGDAPKAKIRIKNGCNKPIVVALIYFYSDWGAARSTSSDRQSALLSGRIRPPNQNRAVLGGTQAQP